MSAFRWRDFPRPSIFMSDTAFTGSKKNGKTQSQVASESVTRITARDGRSPGSIRGLSARWNLLIEESEHVHRRGRHAR